MAEESWQYLNLRPLDWTVVSSPLCTRQLLTFSVHLQHLSLQLVDSLDDLLWAEIFNSNRLSELVSLSLDQCHSLSGDSLQVTSQYWTVGGRLCLTYLYLNIILS